MILKTALSQQNSTSLPNGVGHVQSINGFAFFRCTCNANFGLRETNSFTSWDDVRCSDCKRIGRLKDHIGERYVFRRIKWDAKKAGRSFNISFDWFVKQVHEPCHYCNRTNINSVTVPSKIPGEVLLANFRYNGLDRVDNAVGYEEDNCVPCCVVCNRAKNSMPYEDFIEYISSLVNYQNSMGEYNVNSNHAVPDLGVQYQGRHRKTGNDSTIEESPKDSVPVFTAFLGPNIYHGADGEVWYTYSGSTYRKLEGAVQA